MMTHQPWRGWPGGAVGFLILVNVMVFFLAFFLDYFELSFIVVPLLAPVAEKLGQQRGGWLVGGNDEVRVAHGTQNADP